MAAVMEQWSHAGTSFLSLLFFFMTMIIFMFYNIYVSHACFILYKLQIFVPHNIVFNVLSDKKKFLQKTNLLQKLFFQIKMFAYFYGALNVINCLNYKRNCYDFKPEYV